MEIQEVIEAQIDHTNESRIHFNKLKRKVVISYVSFVLIFFSTLFRRYEDFDVAMSNMLFTLLLALSFIVILYATYILFHTKGQLFEAPIRDYLKKVSDFVDLVHVIPVFIAVLSLSNAFILSPATVTKTSMEPNYSDGDNILVYHLSSNYERFDVVIVKVSNEDYYIKRIIGLPGETVTIKLGEVYINGELLDDPTPLKVGTDTYCSVSQNVDVDQECSFVIPEGEYFVLGDNREASVDSRSIGTIKHKNLYGKVIVKLDFFNLG